jgi:hypothetical protein
VPYVFHDKKIYGDAVQFEGITTLRRNSTVCQLVLLSVCPTSRQLKYKRHVWSKCRTLGITLRYNLLNCTLVISFYLDPQTEGCDPPGCRRFVKSYLECIYEYVVPLRFNETLAENISAAGKALRFSSWFEEEHFIAHRKVIWAPPVTVQPDMDLEQCVELHFRRPV